MALLKLIEDVAKINRRIQKRDDSSRLGILAFTTEYSKEIEDLSASYALVDLDASIIVFYKITGLQDNYLKINNGPGTDDKVIHDAELDSLINIEQPVISYHSGDTNGNMNTYFRNMIEGDNKLLVINNIEAIGNKANISILTNLVLSNQIPGFIPVILVADDNSVRTEIWIDSKDHLRRDMPY